MAHGLKENPNGFNAKYLLSFFEQNGNCGLHSELMQPPEFRFECKENLSSCCAIHHVASSVFSEMFLEQKIY